jgi:hypothetical protein
MKSYQTQVDIFNFVNVGKDQVLTPPTSPLAEKLYVHWLEVGNNGASASAGGVGFQYPTTMWVAGQWTESGGAFTDDTTDAQDAGADDFGLFTTTNNGGHIVMCKDKFNIIGYTVGVAASGGSPAFDYSYYNGSAWVAFTPMSTPTYTATGDTYLVFGSQAAWAKGGISGYSDYYQIRVRATTAPSSAGGSATLMWAIKLIDYNSSIPADNSSCVIDSESGVLIPYGASLVPYMATADAGNWLKVEWRKAVV